MEVYDGTLNTSGSSGDTQIGASAILSGITESVSLSARTVILALHSRLHVKSVVLEIDGRACIGQFHRALFEGNEYVICVVRHLKNNLYELYSVLSPKTGLLHMQVGMGAAVKPHDASVIKGGRIWYGITCVLVTIIFFLD